MIEGDPGVVEWQVDYGGLPGAPVGAAVTRRNR